MAEQNQNQVTLLDQLKNISSYAKILAGFGAFFGFLTLHIYLLRNDAMYQNLSFSDTTLTILLSLIFGFLYAFSILALVGFGNFFLFIPYDFLVALKNRLFKKQPATDDAPSSPISVADNFVIALPTAVLGAVVLLALLQQEEQHSRTEFELTMRAIIVLAIPFLTAYIWRWILRLNAKILQSQGEDAKRQRKGRNMLVVALFVVPVGLSSIFGHLTNRTMVIAHIRQENVTVHVKVPFSDAISSYGIPASASPFGDDYRAFDGIIVLSSGLGAEVVLQHPKIDSIQIRVPNDHIEILELPDPKDSTE